MLTVGTGTVLGAAGGAPSPAVVPGAPVGGVGAAVGTVGAVWALTNGAVHSRMARKRLSSNWKTAREREKWRVLFVILMCDPILAPTYVSLR